MKAQRWPGQFCFVVYALVNIVVAGCGNDSSAQGGLLSGDAAEKLFSGKTVEGHHVVHGYDFRSYYDADGTFASYQDGADRARRGKWWVSGDEFCIRWLDDAPTGRAKGEDLCRRIEEQPNGDFRKILVVKANKRKVIVRYKSFRDGNPDDL